MAWDLTGRLADARPAELCSGFSFFWEDRRVARGQEPLVNPAILRNATLRGGLTLVLLPVLCCRSGVFFVDTAVFVSCARALSSRYGRSTAAPLAHPCCWPPSGIPKVFPHVSPRRVVRLGFLALFAGAGGPAGHARRGRGPEIITWPLLLAGLGEGRWHPSSGAVTVSSVPDEQSGEVGGLQNTVTNLGASIGTALTGAVLIAALTASFVTSVRAKPRGTGVGQIHGHDQVGGWRAVRLQRRTQSRSEEGECYPAGRRCDRQGK